MHHHDIAFHEMLQNMVKNKKFEEGRMKTAQFKKISYFAFAILKSFIGPENGYG